MRNRVLLVFEQKTLLVIIVIGVFLTLISDYFLTFHNITSILLYISIEGIVVFGMAYLIILRELDLSVGSVLALSGFVAIYFQRFGVVSALLSGVAVGVLVGLVNGLLVTKLRLNSIAVTLGMMILLSGVVFGLTGGRSVIGTNEGFSAVANTEILGISMPVFYFVLVCVILEVVLKRTFYGRNVIAIGGNDTAARLAGIDVERVKLLTFVLAGFLSGGAGVLMASKLNIASGRIGMNTPIMVITAVLLGGISLSGGEGSILKALQGIVLIGLLKNTMVLLRASFFLQDILSGAILIGILVIDAVTTRKRKFLR